MAYRILFFGTSSFAVPSLRALHSDARFELIGVVTQPDRPVGRKGELQAPPIKTSALELNVPVYQYETVKDPAVIEELRAMHPDALVVVSFGQIIPQALLDSAPHGAVNVHGSILPMYRGASPIHAAIAAGDTETGVTIMKMDAKMDHGPLLHIVHANIEDDETTPHLHDRLAELGAQKLPDILAAYLEGTLVAQEQDHTHATYVKLLSREDGKLQPTTQSAAQMERLVRAYTPWPGTSLPTPVGVCKILQASIGGASSQPPGAFCTDNNLPSVVAQDGRILHFTELQPEGKKPMDGATFLRGYGAKWSD